MASIFRVKRRRDEEPMNALIVACKRQKTESDEAEASGSLSTIVKFAGTVKEQDENVFEHIAKKLNKEELKSNFKNHFVNIIDKARKETKEASERNRLKVVNLFRSIENAEEPDVKNVTVIDVENTASCSTKSDNSENKEEYVYDLYYTTNKSEDFFLESINEFSEETFVFDSYQEKEAMVEDDSEDSNSESNWKNDYPDSDHSGNSILEEDMEDNMKNLRITNDFTENSSEDEDDDDVYGCDPNDVDYFGYNYAKFKAQALKELDSEISDDSEELSEPEEMSDLDDCVF